MTAPFVTRRRSNTPTVVPPIVIPPGGGGDGTQPAFQLGACIRNQTGDPQKCANLSMTIARIELNVGDSQSYMDNYFNLCYNLRIRIQPLVTYEDDHMTTAQAQSLSTWSNRYGANGSFWVGKTDPLPIRHIEFGNENSYGYKAQRAGYGDNGSNYQAWAGTYAQRAKSASLALTNGVGLLIQLDNASGWNWVNGIYSGVPNIHDYAAGWTSHPYGPTGNNKPIVDAAAVAAKGAPIIPWYFTEWGLSTDNGRTVYQGGQPENYGFNPSMTYVEAGTTARTEIGKFRTYWGTRLKNIMYYLVADDQPSGAVIGSPSVDSREPYFGGQQSNGNDKVGFSNVLRELAVAA